MSFKPKRADGYSLRDIVVNLLKDKPPDTIIPYHELMTALETNDLNLVQSTTLLANRFSCETTSAGSRMPGALATAS